MELKLSGFLHSMNDENLSRRLTTSAIQNLAAAVLQASQLFINSKITLRCLIVSLYADDSGKGEIHSVSLCIRRPSIS